MNWAWRIELAKFDTVFIQEPLTQLYPNVLRRRFLKWSPEMRFKIMFLLGTTALAAFALQAKADTINLGTDADFAVLTDSTATFSDAFFITGGNVGLRPSMAIPNVPPAVVTAPVTLDSADAAAAQAQTDVATPYNAAGALMPTQSLTGQDRGVLILAAEIDSSRSAAPLTGTLTANQGKSATQSAFQIGSAGNSSGLTIDDGSTPGLAVFSKVFSSPVLNSGTVFQENILSRMRIAVEIDPTIPSGSDLAPNGPLGFERISIGSSVPSAVTSVSVPLPTPFVAVSFMIAVLAAGRMSKKVASNRTATVVGSFSRTS